VCVILKKGSTIKLTHILSFFGMPDAELVGLGFYPWVGHLWILYFLLGEVTEKLYISKIGGQPGGAAPGNQPMVAGVCRR
jgi:hypothetical protein